MIRFLLFFLVSGRFFLPGIYQIIGADAATITINWFIPSLNDEDMYDGIKATVGDTVQFQWSGNHNVYIHPSGACSEDNAILVGAQSGKSGSYMFTEDDIGKVAFACDIENHCENGQFVTIRVSADEDSTDTPDYTPEDTPDTTTNAPTSSPTPSPASSASKCRFDSLVAFLMALVLVTTFRL